MLPPVVLKNIQYRLSRIYTGGNDDYITYNKVILFAEDYRSANAKFVEGFAAKSFIIEAYLANYQFRKQTANPVQLYDIDRFTIIGNTVKLPQIRSWLSFTIVPAGFKINEENDIFSCRIRDIDASHGNELQADNSTEYGTNTNIEFYDRDVQSIIKQRNILETRAELTSSPPPESIADPLIEVILNE